MNEVGWGFTSNYYKLGVGLVIDNPKKWDGFKIILVSGIFMDI